MPSELKVFKCDFCSFTSTTMDGAVSHESRCTRNPSAKACQTCSVGPRTNEWNWRCPVRRTASTKRRCLDWTPGIGVGKRGRKIERMEPGKPHGEL